MFVTERNRVCYAPDDGTGAGDLHPVTEILATEIKGPIKHRDG